MKRIAIFASGGGSNAAKIMAHFQDHQSIQVSLVLTNRKKAGVREKAENFSVPSVRLTRDQFYNRPEDVLAILTRHQIDFIALAGFLWLVPSYLVRAFSTRMVNIHPALLPAFGGPGMYGMHVHEAVRAARVSTSGMTVHYVTEEYDQGAIIFQASCQVTPGDSAEDIQEKVLKLEHANYAQVIEELVADLE